MKKRLGTVTALLLLAAALGAGAALGDTTTIQDAKDATGKGPDIKTATAKHANGKLKHVITTYNSFTKAKGPCVHIQTKSTQNDDYIICPDGDVLHASKGTVTGHATVAHPNATTISYVFGKNTIGSPGKYRWRAVSDTCFCDVAPDEGSVTHKL